MSTFVLRKHAAKRAGLHYDLHLDGESWSIPKGMPSAGRGKHLAIQTTYHTPKQARFEGMIPEGQYGAGTSEIADEGEMVVISRKPDHIFFQLSGNLFRGNYHLYHWVGDRWLIWKQYS